MKLKGKKNQQAFNGKNKFFENIIKKEKEEEKEEDRIVERERRGAHLRSTMKLIVKTQLF